MREITIRQATLEDTEFLVAGNAAMAQETEAALSISTPSAPESAPSSTTLPAASI